MTYPATAQDIMAHVLGLLSANQVISAVLDFPGHLDERLLQAAVLESMRQHPVLGCRFVSGTDPRWEPAEGDSAALFTVQHCLDGELAALSDACLVQDWDHTLGQAACRLLRAGHDRLIIAISHLCSDGSGLKAYLAILGDLYTQMEAGHRPLSQPDSR